MSIEGELAMAAFSHILTVMNMCLLVVAMFLVILVSKNKDQSHHIYDYTYYKAEKYTDPGDAFRYFKKSWKKRWDTAPPEYQVRDHTFQNVQTTKILIFALRNGLTMTEKTTKFGVQTWLKEFS
jgi:hypothetical protein